MSTAPGSRRAELDLLRDIVEHCPDALTLLDADGRFEYMSHAGSVRWTGRHVRAIRHPDGTLRAVLVVTRDAHARYLAEQRERARDEQLHFLTDGMRTRLRREGVTAPVVLCSGFRAQGTDADFAAVVTKPYRAHDLVSTLIGVLPS